MQNPGNSTMTSGLCVFSLFQGVDRTITALNSEIDTGEFQIFDLETVEKQFSTVFDFPRNYPSEEMVTLEDGQKISKEFYSCVMTRRLRSFFDLPYVSFFLHSSIPINKYTQDGGLIIDNETVYRAHDQALVMVRALHLLKTGHVHSPTTFLINRENGHISSRLSYGNSLETSDRASYLESDAHAFRDHIKLLAVEDSSSKSSVKDPSFRLAFDIFEESYTTTDLRIRFILLITALEAIFNQGKDQISHSLSRNLSLILSVTEEEYQQNYKIIKRLYTWRSSIVHGLKNDSPSEEEVKLVEGYVRSALQYWIHSKKKKEDLIATLNVSGLVLLEK
jgi:hypothetical protein